MIDDLPLSAFVWLVVLTAPLAVLFAVLSALLERSGPIRMRHWAEESGGKLRALYDAPVRFGVFRFLLSFAGRITPLVLFLALAELLERLHAAVPHLLALGVVVAVVAGAEVTNRVLVAGDPETALRRLTRVYRALLFLLQPLVALLAPLVPARREPEPAADDEDDEASDEEIEAFIDVGTREGIIEPEQGEMLWSIVDFADTQVRSVMTPRIDMVCAPIDSTLDHLAERFVESGHSRLPLYRDSIDRVVGVVHIRDVLRALRSDEPPAVETILNPPFFVPETKPLGELLRELQARFQQVAIVVDEYGGTAGLVTVEDLVEEIVGEIMDEHEALVAELEQLPNGGWRMEGRTHIELIDDLFEVDIEDPEYETVAGLIFSSLGHVPEVGESVDYEGLRFTVEAVADRRIQTVRVERIDVDEAAQEEVP